MCIIVGCGLVSKRHYETRKTPINPTFMNNSLVVRFLSLVVCVVTLATNVSAQIFAGESLNMPGTYDGFSNPPTVDALRNPIQSPSGNLVVDAGLGVQRIRTEIAVPGDVAAGSYTWLFTSGPTFDYYANKWANVAVSVDNVQSYAHNFGPDNSITLSAGVYTVNFEDIGYTDCKAIWMYTSAAPVAITGVTAAPLGTGGTVAAANEPITITVSTSAGPSAEENVYVRYSTDGFGSSALAACSFVGSTGTATIPAQSAGTTVEYYVFSTTQTTPSADFDLVTLNYDNNGGANYSYTVEHPSATSAGNWSNAGTWNTGAVPAVGAMVSINANVTLDVDAEVASLTLAGSTLTDGGAGNTLTIQGGGTFAVTGGSFSAGSGEVAFAGGGTVSGTVVFHDVSMGGGVNFGTGSTVNGTLQLNNGSFINTNRPAYGAASTLAYTINGAYNSSLEWEGTTPVNVQVDGNTALTLDASADFTLTGDLSIGSGSSLSMSTGVGNDLFVGGDWDNDGAFNNGSAAVFFDGGSAQVIRGTTTFDFLLIDNAAGVSLAAGADVRVDDGMTCTNGTFTTTGGTLTLLSDAGGTAWLDDFSGAGSISGTVVQQRFVTGVGSDFHFLSAPFSGATISGDLSEIGPSGSGQIIPTATCDPTQTDPSSPYGNVMELREAGPYPVAGCDQSAWYVVSSGPMTPGRGYACIIPSGTTMDIDGSVPGSPVSYGPLSNSGTEGDGWHLVGNPFPSPINWNAPAGFGGVAQLWQTSGTYTGTFQPLASGAGQIGSMQGFQVRVTGAPATFTLTDADRVTGDPAFYRSSSWYDQLVELDVSGNGFMDKTAVMFSAGGTVGWDDAFDGHKKPSAHGQPTFYTLCDTKLTSINAQGPLDGPRSIPMGLLPGADGSFTISLKTWDNFQATARIFLEDLHTGTWTDLQQGSYSFSMTELDNPDRFVVHLQPGLEAMIMDAGCTGETGTLTVDLGDGSTGAPYGWTAYALMDGSGATIDAGVPSSSMSWSSLGADAYTLSLSAGTWTAEEHFAVDALETADPGFSMDNPDPQSGLPQGFFTEDPRAVSADWDFGDGTASIAELNPVHTYTSGGLYAVRHTVYSADNCSSSTETEVAVRGSTGLAHPEALLTLSAQGLTVILQADEAIAQVHLFDASGRRVAQRMCQDQQCSIQAPAAGFYTLAIQLEEGIVHRTIALVR